MKTVKNVHHKHQQFPVRQDFNNAVQNSKSKAAHPQNLEPAKGCLFYLSSPYVTKIVFELC